MALKRVGYEDGMGFLGCLIYHIPMRVLLQREGKERGLLQEGELEIIMACL
jgi:hypothetical protein